MNIEGCSYLRASTTAIVICTIDVLLATPFQSLNYSYHRNQSHLHLPVLLNSLNFSINLSYHFSTAGSKITKLWKSIIGCWYSTKGETLK